MVGLLTQLLLNLSGTSLSSISYSLADFHLNADRAHQGSIVVTTGSFFLLLLFSLLSTAHLPDCTINETEV